jgi:hypothetical protein
MKIALQYVSDSAGKTKPVQVPIADLEKLMTRLRKHEQTFIDKIRFKRGF